MTKRASKPLLLAGAAIAALTGASLVNFSPSIIWNASASAPIGLYTVKNASPTFGDYVLVEPAKPVRNLIEQRGYLPPETPLVKRVAAMSGQEICRIDDKILIDKTIVAYALVEDSLGRPMPVWRGCMTLKKTQLFLLNDHEKSLDGRYFGATMMIDIIGVAEPVWVQHERPVALAETFNK